MRMVIGPAFVPKASDALSERLSFDQALKEATAQLERLSLSSDIFAAHLEMIQDPMLEDSVGEFVGEGISEREALDRACGQICEMFSQIDDEYLRARVSDVRDVCSRIADLMDGKRANPFEGMPQGAIVVAKEILPSDTAKMDLTKVAAFVTQEGSSTSHVCIIARTYGILALTGFDTWRSVKDGDVLVLDDMNVVAVNPCESDLALYMARAEKLSHPVSDVENIGPILVGGLTRRVYANVFNAQEVRLAIGSGAHGVGLFRSEGIFFAAEGGFPDEQTQFEQYRDAAIACQHKPLVIRTLDIGGDKPLPYCQMPSEKNPFMGMRAIRFSLAHPEIFRVQLRAILRASIVGNVKLMFPMISSVDELESAMRQLEIAKQELKERGEEYDANMPVGIMIETPAAVLLADRFAKMVDFFSIGTNDLTQYMMAADRGNEAVSYLCKPSSEPISTAITMVIEAAHTAGIECCMCGEYASDPSALDFLLEAGLDSFSVSIPQISVILREIQDRA